MITQLKLHNFKNHVDRTLDFDQRITYIVGNNGVGKTNILDAIYYLSFSKSYFASSDVSNINYHADLFAIHGQYLQDGLEFMVSCIQKKGTPKIFKYENKAYNRLSEHIGRIPLVMVSPYDNMLINEGSDVRRKFVDNCIMQFDKAYLEQLVRYNKALFQRNTLLKTFADNSYFDRDMLSIWDEQLIHSGNIIHRKREEFIINFTPSLTHYFNLIANHSEDISIEYRSQLTHADFATLLAQSIDRDRLLRYTSAGVHKDDFGLLINQRPVKTNASQGQQKSYVIALRFAQYQYISDRVAEKPIVLLDDVFANLDHQRITRLQNLILNDHFGQVIITDTDLNIPHHKITLY